MEDMDSIFKQTLRSEMIFQDIRVKELSNRTGISPRTLEGYLSARGSIPPADVAVKIANALNVSVEYLVTGENENDYLRELNILHKSIKNFTPGKKLMLKEFIELMKDFEISKKVEN